MKKYNKIFIFVFFLLVSCEGDRFFDPTLFNHEFKGITYTNTGYLQEHGVNYSIIVDPDDWKSDPQWLYSDLMSNSSVSLSNQTLSDFDFEISQDTIGIPIDPMGYSISPVVPNPIERNWSGIYISYVIPVPSSVFMAIIDEDYRVVKTLVFGLQSAGTHMLIWDLTNEAGGKVYGDVYRCIFKAGSFQSHGDIWVINSE